MRFINERIQAYAGQSVIAALIMGFSVIGIYKNVTLHGQGKYEQFDQWYMMVALALRVVVATLNVYSIITISYNHYLIKRLMGFGLLRNATRFLSTTRSHRQHGTMMIPVSTCIFLLAIFFEVGGMFVEHGMPKSNFTVGLFIVMMCFLLFMTPKIIYSWWDMGSNYNAEMSSMHSRGLERLQNQLSDAIPCLKHTFADRYAEQHRNRVDFLTKLVHQHHIEGNSNGVFDSTTETRNTIHATSDIEGGLTVDMSATSHVKSL